MAFFHSQDSEKFHPLRLLQNYSYYPHRGFLRVSENSVKWRIYFDRGELIYATHSLDPFERLDRHLRRLSHEIPCLTSAIRHQARLNFDNDSQENDIPPPDYQAIIWLIEQQYLKPQEAAKLVKSLIQEVFESYLLLPQGEKEFIKITTNFPILCYLDVEEFGQESQKQLEAWQALAPMISSPDQRPYFFSQSQMEEKLSPEQKQRLSKLLRGFSFRQIAVLTNQSELKIARSLYPLIRSKIIVLREPQPPFDRLPKLTPLESATVESSKTTVAPSERIVGSDTFNSLPSESAPQAVHKIVCVDDSPTILKEINRFLGEHNIAVHAISDSGKALIEIIRIKPDMVLLDVGMPTIDGYQLCRLLRNYSAFKTMPIVMVTGNTGLIDRAKARLAGATDYLTKPFTQSELVKMVFRYLT
jgi:twitching motility two-component system response regulator PilG